MSISQKLVEVHVLGFELLDGRIGVSEKGTKAVSIDNELVDGGANFNGGNQHDRGKNVERVMYND